MTVANDVCDGCAGYAIRICQVSQVGICGNRPCVGSVKGQGDGLGGVLGVDGAGVGIGGGHINVGEGH